ncbi:hypothetical protein DFH05DRAFT_1401798, partial [Lentinula detonsa]
SCPSPASSRETLQVPTSMRKHPRLDETSDDYDTSDSNSHKRKSKKIWKYVSRAPRRSASERKKGLESDEYISSVLNEREVKCAACGSCIQLGKAYEPNNWLKHRNLCPRITLKQTVRFGLLARRQFPYKDFPKLKSDDIHSTATVDRAPVPADGVLDSNVSKWTESEWAQMRPLLSGYARWEVDLAGQYVKSTQCEQQTFNSDSVCDKCRGVANDDSFKRAVRKVAKHHEAQLPEDERLKKVLLREKHASLSSDRMQQIQRRYVNDLLSDKILFDITESLKTGDAHDCFLRLWKHARAGNLNNHQRVVDICEALDDRIGREASDNRKLICGIRYSQNVINFMMMMRSYGHNSHRQYTMFTSVFGGPSSRHLQTLRAKSTDAMQNPYLIFENVARFKRYYDSTKYTGPVIAASDCTKVKARLSFSVQFGHHILGSTMPLEMVEVDTAEDIEEIVKQIASDKTFATQVRAIMMKIPLPRCPAVVIALLPTGGKESAEEIHQMHMRLVAMSEQLNLPLVALAADGAATELSSQSLMDEENTGRPSLVYENQAYGIRLSAPVFRTGPLVSVTDAPHARKTARNQPQHGTHTASLGIGFLVNCSLIEIYMLDGAGLVLRDVDNVDKQDDGAARRIFHTNVLCAMQTTSKSDKYYPSAPFSIHNITTEFVEHFFGIGRELLSDFSYAEFLKIVQHIMVRQRIMESGSVTPGTSLKDSASGYIFDPSTDLRAPSHESIACVIITRSQIDKLVRIAYSEAVHLCRDILYIPAPKIPSFTKQPLLHLSACVWPETIANAEDSDSDIEIGDDELKSDEDDASEEEYEWLSHLNDKEDIDDSDHMNYTAGITAKYTARYSALCDDLETIIDYNSLRDTDINLPRSSYPVISPVAPVAMVPTIDFSKIINADTSKISVAACLDARRAWQSATSTKSERSVKLSDKFALKHVVSMDREDGTVEKKMSPKEGSHRVRIAQDQNIELQKQHKNRRRQERWLATTTKINKSLGSSDSEFVEF